MRKLTVVFSALLLIAAGCIPLRERTHIVNNVFSSELLSVGIKISPDFRYLTGEDTGTFGGFYHLFVKPRAGTAASIIIIDGHYMTPSPSLSGQWFYAYNPFDDREAFFDYGEMRFNNTLFYYATNTVTTGGDRSTLVWIIRKAYRMPADPLRTRGPDPDYRLHNDEFFYDIDTITPRAEEEIPMLITKKGYRLPRRLMVKRMATILQGNYHLMIYYFEDIDSEGFSNNVWDSNTSLTDEQKGFLRQFDERLRGSITVVH